MFGNMAVHTYPEVQRPLTVPAAEFIGITASDIINYDLPSDKLSDKDVSALNSELEDTRFSTEFWKQEIETMLQMGKMKY